MQRIEIIIGVEQEGKTTELLERFLKHYRNDELSKSIKPVFISGSKNSDELHHMCNIVLNDQTDFSSNLYVIEPLENSTDYENVFGSIIISNIKNTNCVFYIDSICEKIEDFHQKLILLCNGFPNKIFNHTFDIIFTMNKLPIEVKDN